MKKEHPILFSTPMVRAILDGSKTATRRVVKLADGSNPEDECIATFEDGSFDKLMDFSKTYPFWKERKCPYGKMGDTLWVRETFMELVDCKTNEFVRYAYKADSPDAFHKQYPHKWKPSLFMKREACRLHLKITELKIQRLHDITDQEAIYEGVKFDEHSGYYFVGDSIMEQTAVDAFMKLWISINGEQSWLSNPYVWVISFEKQ